MPTFFNFSPNAEYHNESLNCDSEESPEFVDHCDDVSVPTTPTSTHSITRTELLHPQLPMMNQSQTSLMEQFLLHHYTFKMSALLINVDSSSNPLRKVLLPRAVVAPVLMDAIYATSALHVFVGNHNSEFRKASLGYYNKAASALHRLIADVSVQRNRTDLEVLLLTSVFLCKYEIISGGVSHWRSHLQGVQKMLDIFRKNQSKLATETVSYVQSLWVHYHQTKF